MRIKRLDDAVVHRIAAGEKEDLPLLCERYATSKLCCLDDLRKLTTFGFRGEALASLSHIARLSVVTRTAGSAVGYKASYIDGRLVGEATPTAANPGTTITVLDLFYNNAVRVTGKAEEYSRIMEVVQRYAINKAGECAVSLRRSGGKADFVTRQGQDQISVIRTIFGEKVSSALLSLEGSNGNSGNNGDNMVTGLVSNAYHQQKSLVFILFINGRLVDSPRLKKAISNLYSEVLLKQTNPLVYLHLKLAPEILDVNVHPTKKEVIFLNEDQVIDTVVAVIRSRISDAGIVGMHVPTLKIPETVPQVVLETVRDVAPTRSVLPIRSVAPSRSVITMLNASPQQYTASTRNSSLPFQRIHTDPKNRTLDYFIHKRARVDEERVFNQPPTNMSLHLSSENPFFTESSKPALPVSEREHEHERDNGNENGNLRPREHVNLRLHEGLRLESNRGCSPQITEILQRHSFVGLLDRRRCFIQFETSLLLMDVPRLLTEWIFLSIVFTDTAVESIPRGLSIDSCLDEFFATEPATIEATLVDRAVLKSEIIDYIEAKAAVLGHLIDIVDGTVTAVYDPFRLRGQHFEARLGGFIFRSIIDVDWDSGDHVKSVYRLYAEFLVSLIWDTEDIRPHIEHSILPAMKRLPSESDGFPSVCASNGSLLQVATVHDLYKIFERC
ncbi:mlh1/mutl/pms2 mismatch repair during mitosis and meiosis [Paramicrosporidium saccamoebae]|uniref:Mlh1/mutl/pms2 mismatch repair during mitosis and meiosis n=1 Tax=Paramicrosporidium saccamoebae TaxID=1246581 RepID=A0A2H9TMP7_9FUNG|nr:mlh1/mutl/pms2 mismatch repair during mitosis and meiosis [Paramicrosporidium saccamoebae]